MHYVTEIKRIRETDKGTDLIVHIQGEKLKDTIERYKYGDKALAEIRLDDNRIISAEQRKKYYATLKDIADYTGNITEDMHDYFKMIYRYMYEDKKVSLSNCTVTEARNLINILMDFALSHDIPLTDLGVNRTDDIDRYLYGCLVNKRCTCCGLKGEVHHIDKVGMGRDRTKINHVGLEVISLCRSHHTEIHTIGEKSFMERHKVYGIKLDKYSVKKMNL